MQTQDQAGGRSGPSPEQLEARYPGIIVPAYYNLPPFHDPVAGWLTNGGRVAELCRRVGLEPDPEQQLALDLIFAGNPDTNRALRMMIAEVLARQNGKTGLFAMCCLGWLFITKERLVIYSAHEAGTASELHTFLQAIIEDSAMLMRRMPDNHLSPDEQLRATHGIYTANGQQRIQTAAGQRLLFKTRTKGGGRGLSANKVILDEAYALDGDQVAALLPTLSAKPDPQVLLGSSAGRPESEYLRSVRDMGRDATNPRLAYVEWCAGPAEEVCDRRQMCDHRYGTPGCGYDKPEIIQLANPALGRRIALDWVETERAGGMPTPEFGRERLGWWDAPRKGETPIDIAEWTLLGDSEDDEDGLRASKIVGSYALALDVAQDSSSSSLSVCGKTADGLSQIELIMQHAGTDWLLDAIEELFTDEETAPLVLALDPYGPAGSLVPELLERQFQKSWKPEIKVKGGKHRLFLVNATEYAQACGSFVQAVRNQQLVHLDQESLNRAVQNVTTTSLADAYKWDRKDDDVDISPLVSATLARLAHQRFQGAESWVGFGWS